ncbi:MAG: hypothetical protein WCG34_07575 [Leptolinea sp.]
MEHQPFENWILSGESLTTSQSAELDNHLVVCQHCQFTQEGIMGVEDLLKSATIEAPSPGFTNRFRYLAASRKEEAKRLQSYFFLGGILAATVLVSFGYFAILLLTQSPAIVISNLMTNAISLAFGIDELLVALQAWARYVPWPVSLTLGAVISNLIILITSAWLLSVWKVTTRGVKVYE